MSSAWPISTSRRLGCKQQRGHGVCRAGSRLSRRCWGWRSSSTTTCNVASCTTPERRRPEEPAIRVPGSGRAILDRRWQRTPVDDGSLCVLGRHRVRVRRHGVALPSAAGLVPLCTDMIIDGNIWRIRSKYDRGLAPSYGFTGCLQGHAMALRNWLKANSTSRPAHSRAETPSFQARHPQLFCT